MLIGHDPLKTLHILGTGTAALEIEHRVREDGYSFVKLVHHDDFLSVPEQSYCMFGFVNVEFRKKWLAQLNINNYHWPSFIHRSAVVPVLNAVGPGCIIGALTHIAFDAKLSAFCWIADMSTLSHGGQLGINVCFGPGVITGGSIITGNNVYVGMNCSIKDRLTITDDCSFAMNTIVRKNITHPGKYYSNGLRCLQYGT